MVPNNISAILGTIASKTRFANSPKFSTTLLFTASVATAASTVESTPRGPLRRVALSHPRARARLQSESLRRTCDVGNQMYGTKYEQANHQGERDGDKRQQHHVDIRHIRLMSGTFAYPKKAGQHHANHTEKFHDFSPRNPSHGKYSRIALGTGRSSYRRFEVSRN